MAEFKACPRCGKNLLPHKTICSFCGAVIREGKVQEQDPSKGSQKNRPCAICGKIPMNPSTCPNCGTTGICGLHIYKFHSDEPNSPEGCPKCGPRCASCGTQTALVHFNGRSLCSVCFEKFSSPAFEDKEKAKIMAEKLQKTLSTLLTFIGLGAGFYLGTKPDMQKILIDLIKTPYFKGPVVTAAWSVLGLIAGSIVGAIVSSFIKTD